MADPNKAVFLSYASQDVEAAQSLCNALRSAGIEVWFDQSELRGGDAWDVSIRRQIKSCALFIPMISNNTHTRGEGTSGSVGSSPLTVAILWRRTSPSFCRSSSMKRRTKKTESRTGFAKCSGRDYRAAAMPMPLWNACAGCCHRTPRYVLGRASGLRRCLPHRQSLHRQSLHQLDRRVRPLVRLFRGS